MEGSGSAAVLGAACRLSPRGGRGGAAGGAGGSQPRSRAHSWLHSGYRLPKRRPTCLSLRGSPAPPRPLVRVMPTRRGRRRTPKGGRGPAGRDFCSPPARQARSVPNHAQPPPTRCLRGSAHSGWVPPLAGGAQDTHPNPRASRELPVPGTALDPVGPSQRDPRPTGSKRLAGYHRGYRQGVPPSVQPATVPRKESPNTRLMQSKGLFQKAARATASAAAPHRPDRAG